MVQTQKRWVIKEPGESEVVNALAEALSIDQTLANLLVQRGVTTFEEARTFFRPSLDALHDPFLMADLDRAVTRLHKAMEGGEKIMVYGDYDVDGTTSVALVHTFLKERGADVLFYIPDRYTEGYGVSLQGVDFTHEQGCTLLITLDCGIKAHASLARAKEHGIDVIVCDHHLPEELPPAFAVLDPKRSDCSYPFDELSGCGVGFKLLQGYCQRYDIPFESLLPLLDLLSVSIAADIVPIIGENRTLAYFGLKQINEKPRPGIEALLNIAKKEKNINITDLVFQVAPRINAAGRIESGMQAVELLTTDDEAVAEAIAQRIDGHNAERKKLDEKITSEALAMIAESDELVNAKSTVLYSPDWHKGVIGIVASRVMETYYRPTVMLTESQGMVTGSARSVSGFDVHAAITACADLLDRFGGHKHAAGLTLKPENVDAFKARFEEEVNQHITSEQMIPRVKVDAPLDLSEVTPKFFRILDQLAPFGPGNMRPLFLTENLRDGGWASIVGDNHLRMNVSQQGHPTKFNAIAFRQGRHHPKIARKHPFDMVYSIEPNEWQGRVTMQLNVKDIRLQDEG